MQIREAIVLAGGLGTRLRNVIGEFPKPLAPINNVPFLQYLLDYLKQNGIQKAVLAVGYKWELIQEKFGNNYKGISLVYSVESTPLGTGGAIKLALEKITNENCFVLNGDTLFNISLTELAQQQLDSNAECSIALKQVDNGSRYGSITMNDSGAITAFNEKVAGVKAIISGGIYCLASNALSDFESEQAFSFETDYLSINAESGKLYGKLFNAYFKDIGIPVDYRQFEKDLKEGQIKISKYMPYEKIKIDSSWTLFLDRDGVMNERLIDDYVKQLNELRIIENVPKAVQRFTELFGRIVVVTNQQGIGRGMMTTDDLSMIHGFIEEVIKTAGGKIDKFYFAPQLRSENSNYRKPGTGMGLQAQLDYPEIDFSKSIMVGDSESDIEFGMKLGMKTVMLKNSSNVSTKADYIFRDLYQVSQELIN
ncbi:MAG: D-glycero-alpha-D-manno-heptose 1-phosphate guanylyltransferase [Crocinitomix sp.]|jgi:D-glycero-alpha-D-manno-heptose 1-phosphate guanylyltransferase